jgi:hypothetical protein
VPWVAASSWLAGPPASPSTAGCSSPRSPPTRCSPCSSGSALERTGLSERKRVAAVALVSAGAGVHRDLRLPRADRLRRDRAGARGAARLGAGRVAVAGPLGRPADRLRRCRQAGRAGDDRRPPPTARSRQEWVLLPLAALAVPVGLLAPYLLHDPSAVNDALSYSGLPGLGGFGLAVHGGPRPHQRAVRARRSPPEQRPPLRERPIRRRRGAGACPGADGEPPHPPAPAPP